MRADQTQDNWDRLLNESDDNTSSQRTPMRYATVVLDAGPDGFYPDYRSYIEQASVTHERIHQIHLLNDGTIAELYQFRGDLNRVAATLEASSHVLHYDVAETEDGSGLVYLHMTATDATMSLLALLREFELVLDPPLEITGDGTTRVTVIGEGTALQQALSAASEIVAVRLEKTGKYRPEGRDLASLLTDRQHQILSVAVAKGYYEIPREATISDVATEVGLSQSTVGEHLQKIEARILSQAVR